eukprot:COSAG03_NODE_111_length_12507_cov_28.124355_2_plen_687_part_00
MLAAQENGLRQRRVTSQLAAPARTVSDEQPAPSRRKAIDAPRTKGRKKVWVIAQDKQRYEIESLLARRQTAEGEEYYVKWAGYSETSSTWEPAHAFKGDWKPLLRSLGAGSETNHGKRPQPPKKGRAKQTRTSSAPLATAAIEPAVGSGGAAVMQAPPEVGALVMGWRVDLPAVIWARNGDASSKAWAAVQKRGATFEVIVRALMVGAVPLQLFWRIQHQDEPIFDVRTAELYEYLGPTQQLLVERVRQELGATSDVERKRHDAPSYSPPPPARHVRMWQGKAAAARSKKGSSKQTKRSVQPPEQAPAEFGLVLHDAEDEQPAETTFDSADSAGGLVGTGVIGEGFDSLSYGAGGASSYFPSLSAAQPQAKRRKQHSSKHSSERNHVGQADPWVLSLEAINAGAGDAVKQSEQQTDGHSGPLLFEEIKQTALSESELSPRLPSDTGFSWVSKSDGEVSPASPQPPSTMPTVAQTQSTDTAAHTRAGDAGAHAAIVPQGLRGTLRVVQSDSRASLRATDSGRQRQKLGGGIAHSPAADRGVGGLQKAAENQTVPQSPLVLDFFGVDGSEGVPEHCKEQLQLARRRKGSSVWEDYNLAFTAAAAQATGAYGEAEAEAEAERVVPVARIPDDQANELWLFARRGESLRCAAAVPVVPTHDGCVMTTEGHGPQQATYHVLRLDDNAPVAE